MSSISPLTKSMQQIAQVSEGSSMKELGSLKGIGEHLLYLFTFGQVDKGRERLDRFTQLVGNLMSLGSLDDGTLACQFLDPHNKNQVIKITIRYDGIQAEVTNTATGAPGASEHLPAVISASDAEMTRLLLELCMAERKNGAREGPGVNEGGADLTNIDLRGARLEGADLRWAHLEGAHLAGAHLAGAHLEGAHLAGADLMGAHLMGAHLMGAHLMGAHLAGADLMGAHLAGAHLEGADLMGAHLAGAHLEGADLMGADLMGANLEGAHLMGANLEGADLMGAHLAGAKISQENLVLAGNCGAYTGGAVVSNEG